MAYTFICLELQFERKRNLRKTLPVPAAAALNDVRYMNSVMAMNESRVNVSYMWLSKNELAISFSTIRMQPYKSPLSYSRAYDVTTY
jgi:hypothetical protein